MKLVMPWSDWFNKQAKRRRKVEPWVLAEVSLEEDYVFLVNTFGIQYNIQNKQ